MYIVLPIVGMSALMYLHTMIFGIPLTSRRDCIFNMALESFSVRIPQWIYVAVMVDLLFTGYPQWAEYMCFGLIYYLLFTQIVFLLRELQLKNLFTIPLLLFTSYMYIMGSSLLMTIVVGLWFIYTICCTLYTKINLGGPSYPFPGPD